MKLAIILSIVVVGLVAAELWNLVPNAEVKRENWVALSADQLRAPEFPWAIRPGVVTQVTAYRSAYDIEGNDWIAQFSLAPAEARSLAATLSLLPDSRKSYRCIKANADWALSRDICSYDAMMAAGFKPYFHNPSLCPAGCRLAVVLWMNEVTGESYIIGAPD